MKKKYTYTMDKTWRLWHDPNDTEKRFIELDFYFSRKLTNLEINKVFKFFANEFLNRELSDNFTLNSIIFIDNNHLNINVRHLKADRERNLLQMIVKFREQFPVISDD